MRLRLARMARPGLFHGHYSRRERARRIFIMGIVAVVILVPGGVALAIILTGNLGPG